MAVVKVVVMNSSVRIILLVALTVLIGASFMKWPRYGNTDNTELIKSVSFSSQGQMQTVTLTKVSGDAFAGSRILRGSSEAPVRVVVFIDFQCPACAEFAKTAQAQIKSEFVDTGKIRLAFQDFPLPQHLNAHADGTAIAASGVIDARGPDGPIWPQDQDRL